MQEQYESRNHSFYGEFKVDSYMSMQLNLRTNQPIRIQQANGSIHKPTLGQYKSILIFTFQQILTTQNKGLFIIIRIYNVMNEARKSFILKHYNIH